MDKPHIYMVRGTWTCAKRSGEWSIFPYGKGVSPMEAHENWRALSGTLAGNYPLVRLA